jgi:PEGA domain
VTDPDRPADIPAGPTPEEISARLEALLKRTHALKANKAAEPSASLTMTWPPPDRELDHYDVVDVPEDDRMTAPPPPNAPTPVRASAPASPTDAETRAGDKGADSFARPDWSELRLRSAPEEPTGPSRGWIVLTVLLAIAAIGQAAYIWMGPATATAEGRLRVDGPDGAVVRVNGQAIGPAPIDHVLAPGDYDVEVGSGTAMARAERVSIGVGRTIVLLPAATSQPQAASAAAVNPAQPAVVPAAGRPAAPRAAVPAPTTAPGPTTNPTATAAAAIAPGRGGVLIESTPSGLPVTMEGRERGVTPITIGQLKPGRHDVLVGGLTRKVDITAGTVTSLRVHRP